MNAERRIAMSSAVKLSSPIISKKVRESWAKRQPDLSGRIFGKLKVICSINCAGRVVWNCQCECGNIRVVRYSQLVDGEITMCGQESKLDSDLKNRKSNGISTWTAQYRIYKRTATKRCIPFVLAKQEFIDISSKNCYYCGESPRVINHTKKKIDPQWGNIHANGIDRVDNSFGYVVENCVPCCWNCNNAKKEKIQEDFYSWIKQVHEHLKSEGKI